MKTINLEIGSTEWQSAFSASKAPAMLGLSEYQSRTELIRQMATGIGKEIDAATQARFDAGHASEAVTRAWAEKFIGEELYVLTGETVVDGLRLVASFDGITMDESICWENKLWNEAFAEQVRNGIAPDTHWPQMEHQLIVSGGRKCLFTVSDGAENIVSMWYESDQKRRAQVLAGWKQFAEDVAAYQHVEVIPAAVAAPIKDLPAIVITASGSLTIETNFARWGVELRKFIAKIPEKPATDQEFADCKAAIAAFKYAEEMLDSEEKRVLSKVLSIEDMQREKKLLFDLSRTTRLSLEKLVVSRDLAVKAEIIQSGKDQIAEYIAKLNDSIGGNWVPTIAADFAQAIKSKRSYEVMRSSVADLVAQTKVEAKGIADRINQNRQELVGELDWSFLFPDWQAVCTKPCDDFAALLSMRITNHNAAEEKRMESERAKIRAEERAKAEHEAQAKAQAEADRIRAAERGKAKAEQNARNAEMQRQQAEQDARDAETARQRLIEQERQAKERAEYAAQIKASAEQKIAEANARDAMQHGFGPASAVIEHQDIIAAFIASRDFKAEAGKIRAILVEYEKFKATRS